MRQKRIRAKRTRDITLSPTFIIYEPQPPQTDFSTQYLVIEPQCGQLILNTRLYDLLRGVALPAVGAGDHFVCRTFRF